MSGLNPLWFDRYALAVVAVALIASIFRLFRRRAAVGLRIAFMTALVAALGCLFAVAPPGPRYWTAPMPAALRESIGKYRIPAMALVATRAGATIEVSAAGVRHAGLPEQISGANRFHLGSCTKAMTSTLLAILIEQGKLSWNTQVLDVFPEWKAGAQPDYGNITVTDLLCHQAGLWSYSSLDNPEEWQDLIHATGAGTRSEQRREFARLALLHKPEFQPRTRFSYSNAGYTIAGAMAERVTGETWESLMRTRLFEPLGIDAAFDWPAFNDASQPWGHREARTGVTPHDPHDAFQEPASFAPGGGVAMSPGDYAKFLQLHLKGLEGYDGLLKAATIRHLHTPPGTASRSSDGSYAFGWYVTDFEGALASRHSGTVGTFNATVAMWPSRDLAVAVFSNSYGMRSVDACLEILHRAAHHYQAGAYAE